MAALTVHCKQLSDLYNVYSRGLRALDIAPKLQYISGNPIYIWLCEHHGSEFSIVYLIVGSEDIGYRSPNTTVSQVQLCAMTMFDDDKYIHVFILTRAFYAFEQACLPVRPTQDHHILEISERDGYSM